MFKTRSFFSPTVLISLLLLLLLAACETPEKVLKSTDLEYKKAKATHWYNKKEYFKCIPVLEELIGLMKGRESVEELYYMYCMANYKQGDYMISGYHFKNFFDQYSNSSRAEECLYMYAKSYQELSPKADLDQTYTYKALEAYAFFLNMFPINNFKNETNEAVSKLRKKLEKKALGNAELYYRTGNYKAAATAYENLLRDFPDIDDNEKISYMIVRTNFMFSQNSVPHKKTERFNHVIKSYNDFKYKFAGSKYTNDAAKYEQQSHYLAVKSAFEWAEICPLAEREKNFNIAFREVNVHKEFITNEKEKKELAQWVEKGHYQIVKNYFLLSEEKVDAPKIQMLEKTIKTYYTFVDLFPNSRFAKEAEQIFKKSTEQLQKLKQNG